MSVFSRTIATVLRPVLGPVFDARAGVERAPADAVTFDGENVQFNGTNITYRGGV